jgi:hypothetical protein
MADKVDIALLAKLCQDTLAETKAIRQDLANVQMLATKTVDVLTKMEKRNEARSAAVDGRFAIVDARLSGLDQRIGDFKDELGLMIRSELMGALGSFEAKMVGLIEDRLARKD